MLNIQTQCCGLLLLWIVTYFFHGLRRVEVKTQKTFWFLLMMMNVCVLCDILSIFAIGRADTLPKLLVDMICKFYLLTLVLVVFSGLIYICSDIYANDAAYRRVTLPYRIVMLIFSFLIMLTPVKYTFENGGEIVYSYGPSVIVSYIAAVSIIISMILFLAICHKKTNPKRWIAVLLWISIWIVAAVTQYFIQRLLIVSFAGVLGVTIIYMTVENPVSNLDKDSGFFNLSAMMQYLTEAYANNRSLAIVNIVSSLKHNPIIRQPKGSISFVGGGEIFLVAQRGDIEMEHFSVSDVPEHTEVFYIPDTSIAASPGELMSILREAQKIPMTDRKNRLSILNTDFMKMLAERRHVEKMIQHAMDNDTVEIFYQPIYSTRETIFCSAEALVRIRDDDGKIIPPNVFIPIAESNGAIIELGKIILDKVCHFLSRHEEEKLGLQYVEVNLSAIQGEDENLASDIIQIINKHGVSSECVNLEITETASITGKKQLLENMNALIKEGIDFSLDDFGTGQSNLDYMADMPVTLVKFDRKMTQGYFESEKVRHIMNAAIQMIHGMGMSIVAEGIETKEQLDTMLEQKIEYIQGYYFSKPIPEDEFEVFLKQNNH